MRLGKFLTYVALVVWTCFVLFPIYWTLITSFKQPMDVVSFPPKLVFKPTTLNYEILLGIAREVPLWERFRPDFPRYFLNSLIICGGAVLLSLALGTPAAYALARYKLKYGENIYFTYITFWFFPPFVFMIPLYVMYRHLGLYDTHVGLIFAYQLIALPLTVWMMVGFFEEIPKEIEEAAMVDGCSLPSLLLRVVLPLAAPGMAATAILDLVFCWGDYLFALILTSRRAITVTYSLSLFITYNEVLWGQMAAGGLICMLPIMAFSWFAQKYIVRGLTFGAVKG